MRAPGARPRSAPPVAESAPLIRTAPSAAVCAPHVLGDRRSVSASDALAPHGAAQSRASDPLRSRAGGPRGRRSGELDGRSPTFGAHDRRGWASAAGTTSAAGERCALRGCARECCSISPGGPTPTSPRPRACRALRRRPVRNRSRSLLGPVIGVMKAYATRVGGGPVPLRARRRHRRTLRERGAEFGTTTGRPRRCGWFDAVAARYAVDVCRHRRGRGHQARHPRRLRDHQGGHLVSPARTVSTTRHLPGRRRGRGVPRARLSRSSAGLGAHPTEGVVREERPAGRGRRATSRFLEEKLGVPAVVVSTGPAPRRDPGSRRTSALADQLRVRSSRG